MPLKIYRLARWLLLHRVPILPRFLKILNRLLFSVVLPPSAELGKDVILGYQGLGTVIHRHARIGDRVNIGTCVTIGGRSGRVGAPVIGDDVMIGSGAKILGSIHIGRGASIGANAVVLDSLPEYSVAVGVPAKVVRINDPTQLPNYHQF